MKIKIVAVVTMFCLTTLSVVLVLKRYLIHKQAFDVCMQLSNKFDTCTALNGFALPHEESINNKYCHNMVDNIPYSELKIQTDDLNLKACLSCFQMFYFLDTGLLPKCTENPYELSF